MENLYFNLGVIFVLILINGIFSLSELAVVSSTKARLQKLVSEKRLGAKAALKLHEEPNYFLSTVQVGITAVGILSGVFGEDALEDPIKHILMQSPDLAPYAATLALVATVTCITYFSVVLGELVPKRIALQNPEGVACTIAKPMQSVAFLVSPLVWFFSVSSRLLLRLVGLDRMREAAVSDEEIRIMMEMGAEAGVFHEEESRLVNNVMKMDDMKIGAVMVPRQMIYFVDILESKEKQRQMLVESPYFQIVVCQGGFEHILGVLNYLDFAKALLSNPEFQLETGLRPAVYVHNTMTLAQLLKQFRQTRSDIALVVNEYGDLEGLVTVNDLLTAIVGELPAITEGQTFEYVQRADGSWLVDGDMPITELKSLLTINLRFPGEATHAYHTLAGMILFTMQKLPKAGDSCLIANWKFEVMDMDGTRIDKVLIVPMPIEE